MYSMMTLGQIQGMLIGIPEERRNSEVFKKTINKWATLAGTDIDLDKVDDAVSTAMPPFDEASLTHLKTIRFQLEAHIRWARNKQGTPHLSLHATGRDVERFHLVRNNLIGGRGGAAGGTTVTTRRGASAKASGLPTFPIKWDDPATPVELQLLRRHSDDFLLVTRQTATRNTRGLPLALMVFSNIYADWHLHLLEMQAGRFLRDIIFAYLSWFRSPGHYKYIGKKRAVDRNLHTAFVPWDIDWMPRMWGKYEWFGRDLSGNIGEQDSVLAQQTRFHKYEKAITRIAKDIMDMPAAMISPLQPIPETPRSQAGHPSRYISSRVSDALHELIEVRFRVVGLDFIS